MSDRKPLMPKATAVWLVDNTALTFEQIAAFCGLHVLEVKGIADGDVAQGIKGMDPISSGQLSRDELKKAEDNEGHVLRLMEANKGLPELKKKKARYTPTSRRNERPNAILWLLRNHQELKDAQIIRLTGTTKPTLTQIRDRTHWNSPNLVAQDPVTLGLCSQMDLDAEVQKASVRADKDQPGAGAGSSGTLLPTSVTTAEIIRPKPEQAPPPPPQSETFAEGDGGAAAAERLATQAAEDARVFAQLKGLGTADEAAAAPAATEPAAEAASEEPAGKAPAAAESVSEGSTEEAPDQPENAEDVPEVDRDGDDAPPPAGT